MQPKSWFTSKTLIFNLLAIAIFALGFVMDNAGVLQLDPRAVVLFSGLVGVCNLCLRLVTNSAVAGTPAATDALVPVSRPVVAPAPVLDTLPPTP